MASPAPYRLLAAVLGDALKRATLALGDDFDNRFVMTLQEAKETLLSERFDAIACNVHFDNNRMFDLLRFVKSNPKTKSIPFLCILSKPGTLSHNIFESVRLASKTLGASDFIPIHDWRLELGDEVADAMMRQRIWEAVFMRTPMTRTAALDGMGPGRSE